MSSPMSSVFEGEKRLYPENELTNAPLATPLSGPKIPVADCELDEKRSGLASPYPSTAAQRKKHESYTLSGSVFLIAGNGKTLKLPAPSASPADPLGWSKWKRIWAFVAVVFFNVVALAVVQAAGIFLRVISRDFKIDHMEPWQVDMLLTTPSLFNAIGAIVWVPLTIGVGRRPVFLFVTIITMAATLGAGYTSTFEQFLACVCFLGLGQGFALTVTLLIVFDMTFIDERPKAIAILYSVGGLFGTGFVSIAPYISDGGNQWRSYYRYWSIAAFISVVLVFFLVPETYFKRPTVAFDGLIVLQSATEKVTVFQDIEAESDIYRDLPDLPQQVGLLGRYNVWKSSFGSWTSMARCYAQIAFCLLNPLIFWMSLALALNAAGMMFIGTSYPRILGEPPYSLSSSSLTLINIASALGGLVAYPLGVLPVQCVVDRLTRRNRGIREAEHYLVGLIAPVLAGAASSLLYGLAVHYSLPLAAYYLAWGLNGFSWVTICISSTMWVTEAFPRWAAPALTAMSAAGFVVTFGLSFVSAPWTDAHGFKLVGVELAVLQIVSGLVAVPIAFWGKSARQAIMGRWSEERGGALRPL
ncbi:major facilitator superfamily domain-containing protein [Phaeosphaeria sp. MPI-PUGE-AT-0046c]|nr:major facilitator superfamily domain-containing protein [Phaeosphaeria sp. MPI-PUGE-AT-0046c]